MPVLRDIDLTIRAGSAVGVIGELGSGKSTLARVIAGLLPAARGTIELAGKPLARRGADRGRRELRDIQIVFQMADTALNPAHTVGRILGRPVALLPRPCRRPRASARRRAARHGAAAGRFCRPPAGRALGRAEAARQPGPRARRQAEAHPVRRGDVEPRYRRRRGDPEAAGRPAPRARRRLPLHQPRSVDGAGRLRRDRRALRRPGACSRRRPRRSASRRSTLMPICWSSSIPELRIGWLDGLPAAARCRSAARGDRGAPSARAAPSSGRCGLAIAGTCDALPPPERRLAQRRPHPLPSERRRLLAAQRARCPPHPDPHQPLQRRAS